jgi:hypothetical protein
VKSFLTHPTGTQLGTGRNSHLPKSIQCFSDQRRKEGQPMHPKTTKLPDTQIRHAVLRQFEWEPEVSHDQIGVGVTEGVVTLSGEMDTESGSTLYNFGPLSGPKLDKVESGRNNYKNSG